MEDKISYKYADDLKALADEFAETPNPNGPFASGIYEKKAEKPSTPPAIVFNGKTPCPGCDADADCGKCDGKNTGV